LPDWEQNLLLSSLQRIAAMMGVEHIEVAPALSSSPVPPVPKGVDMMETLAQRREPTPDGVNDPQSFAQ